MTEGTIYDHSDGCACDCCKGECACFDYEWGDVEWEEDEGPTETPDAS